MPPYSQLADKIDEFEKWKDLVSEGNLQNLEHMTFLEFMAKLDRLIEKYEKEAKAAKEHADALKAKMKHGRK